MSEKPSFFAELKRLQPSFLIIDDKCLCRPDYDGLRLAPFSDVTLFSTGYSKYVDLGFGGFAFLDDSVPYRRHARGFAESALLELTRRYKDAIAELASGQSGADLPQEKSLVAALDKAEPKASVAIETEDFTAAMAALASLRKPIDDFFDHVTVNDPDPAKRERRLNLLMRFRDAVNRVADFSRIEG